MIPLLWYDSACVDLIFFYWWRLIQILIWTCYDLVLTTSVIGDRVVMRVISLTLMTILHVRSFMTTIDRLYLLVTLRVMYGWSWESKFIVYFDWIILFMTVDHYPSWISWFTWETWLIILNIYLITIMFILLNLLGKYYYTVTTPACLLVIYILVIPVSCSLILYTPVIPVPWLSHVDIVTVTTTELSHWFK